MIKSLYTNSTNAMLLNSIQGQIFKTTVGVRDMSTTSCAIQCIS